MSRNYNYYGIQKDTIPVFKGKYFYKLSYEPIMDSFNIQFDISENVTRIRFNEDNEYHYESYETYYSASELEFKVVNILPDGYTKHEELGIIYVPVTSQEALLYAKELIGTRHVINKQFVNIDSSNYTLYYKNLITGWTFIDFSLSEKIMKVVDAVDTTSGLQVHDQFDATYFFGQF